MMRTISLLPSSTEIACAIGTSSALVGRSHECDFPPEVARLPVLTRPRIDTAAPSATIDREVKGIVERGLSVYEVDAERLRELAPDIVLTQTLCEVCAVTPQDLERALGDWIEGAPRIISLAPNRLADVWEDMRRVGRALGGERQAERVVRDLVARVESLAERATTVRRPRVACVEWIDPLMASGNWIPELVALAAGDNLFGAAGAHAPWLEFDALVRANPDVILVLPCGFDIARSRRELAALTTHAGWPDLAAVKQGEVYLLDGNQYFNRPGPRLVDSLEILCEILHPQTFAPRHFGAGWVQV